MDLQIYFQRRLLLFQPRMQYQPLVQALKPSETAGIEMGRSEFARAPLKQRQDVENISDFGGAQRGNPRAAIGPNLNQPARSENLQSLAKRRPGDSEPIAQFPLRHPAPGQ
jgi:hypothetical protein